MKNKIYLWITIISLVFFNIGIFYGKKGYSLEAQKTIKVLLEEIDYFRGLKQQTIFHIDELNEVTISEVDGIEETILYVVSFPYPIIVKNQLSIKIK